MLSTFYMQILISLMLQHSLDIDSLSVMDKWLLSKLNTTVKK